ncbi:hypothetical protein C8J55DRAFT_554500 [Lentinula edodes]|uniref:Uncharacterized protein n=1 Tax=Lentinula lateritia TaxID=40482 RepID=A0A9W9E0X1_9AGAR|nr:hypothetical protein C8J55DRAFT_554500 [Lentinula edodes]
MSGQHNSNASPGHNLNRSLTHTPNTPPGVNHRQHQTHPRSNTGYAYYGYPAPVSGGNAQGVPQQTGNTVAFPYIPAAQGVGAGPTRGEPGRVINHAPMGYQNLHSALGQPHRMGLTNYHSDLVKLQSRYVSPSAPLLSSVHTQNEAPLRPYDYSPPAPEHFGMYPTPQRQKTAEAQMDGLQRHGKAGNMSDIGDNGHQFTKFKKYSNKNVYDSVLKRHHSGSRPRTGVAGSSSIRQNIVPTAFGFEKCQLCGQPFGTSDTGNHERNCLGHITTKGKGKGTREDAGKD